MNRVTIASVGFLVFAVAVSIWLLTRGGPAPATDDASLATIDPHAGLTFAEWSVKSDGVLLADIDPGAGVNSTDPRKFLIVNVKRLPDGTAEVSDGATFSWARESRAANATALAVLGFRVSAEGRAYVPPDDPLWSDPIPRVDGGTEQVVRLKAKSGGATATFTRHHSDPHSSPFWNRRAIGFPSGDGHFVYVTPDAIVIAGSH